MWDAKSTSGSTPFDANLAVDKLQHEREPIEGEWWSKETDFLEFSNTGDHDSDEDQNDHGDDDLMDIEDQEEIGCAGDQSHREQNVYAMIQRQDDNIRMGKNMPSTGAIKLKNKSGQRWLQGVPIASNK
ncbi:hypothetical protein K435DRAFT_863735 [Dendrothele bispora CBS 962.96]|uniref:Uncharacterized protein n=1 Tax=Dendrothele bispora (strain CBS 962.96) TaxID=1314807 RepID=A0A4S8LPJ0_DENBC|nr:hypothetical protein K435DRAFT_863735 [Dendrothele bispora CBS 962.96]